MGMRGPVPKREGAQGHRAEAAALVPAGGGNLAPNPDDSAADLIIPEPPAGLLAATRRRWLAYWTSGDAANAIQAPDLPAAERLFVYYDEHDRLMREFRKNRLTEGSQGQLVLHPAFKGALALEKEIRALEAQLGISPLARMRLGLTAAQQALTVDQLNRAAEVPEHRPQPAVLPGEAAPLDGEAATAEADDLDDPDLGWDQA